MLLQDRQIHDDALLVNAPLSASPRDAVPDRLEVRRRRRREVGDVLQRIGDDGALTTLDNMMAIRALAQRSKTFAFDLPFRQFITMMALLTPQSYGSRIQKYISLVLKYFPVSASENRGDFRDANDVHRECKASLIGDAGLIHIVQIRPWQKVCGYVVVGVDIRPDTRFQTYMFMLTKEQMVEEAKNATVGGGYAHGTKKSNKGNKNVELRMSLRVDPKDETFARWCRLYQCRYDLEYRANLYFQRGDLRA